MQTSPQISPRRSSCSSAWCAQVTVVPEVSRISVLSSGRCQGSNTSMPCGGQWPPVNWALATWTTLSAERLESKNAQNHATKNITSEAMNRIMP